MNTAPVVAVLGYPIHHSKSQKCMGTGWIRLGVGILCSFEIHPDNFEVR